MALYDAYNLEQLQGVVTSLENEIEEWDKKANDAASSADTRHRAATTAAEVRSHLAIAKEELADRYDP